MKLPTPQQYFKLHGSRPRKRFGQHFLAQPATAERIVQSADLLPSDVVVEVGPGLGALTRFLVEKVERLHLVELDRDLAALLEDAATDGASPCRVTVYAQDVMTFDFLSLSRAEGEGLVVVGNLPYNISSPLMFHLLEARSAIKHGVFMVQKEVGERLAAGPGTKDYGVLSVLLGACAEVKPLFTVGPSQFYPPPRVDSLVFRIRFFTEPWIGPPSFAALRRVVNTAFQQRRKTLANSLRGILPQSGEGAGQDPFATADIDPKRRPETLSSEEFLRLTAAVETARMSEP